MLEAEVLPERGIRDFDGHDDESPALVADVCLVAARSNLVVVRQIDIENELLGQRPEDGGFAQGLAVARVRGVDGADFETRWV